MGRYLSYPRVIVITCMIILTESKHLFCESFHYILQNVQAMMDLFYFWSFNEITSMRAPLASVVRFEHALSSSILSRKTDVCGTLYN